MPIGVPKVSFRISGEEDMVRIDTHNRPYRERLPSSGQHMDDETANQPIRITTHPNGENRSQDTHSYTNPPGGAVSAGISVYDTMQSAVPDVHTIRVGLAASMGPSISTGGEITRRMALPHARVMIHQPASSFYEGQAGERLIEAEEILKLRDCIAQIHAQKTGKPLWVVSKDMERDVFTPAREARVHGITDPVVTETSPRPTVVRRSEKR
uniref:ATP-dependent Clp protease proteolytic subunit n=1 Tax=Selaginella pennata TaxID=1715390 RepID=A0A482CHM5_9TRAC|nr:clp protease proteolytic subunit [Selaginella pennata]QBL76203.1 clp protease proteolytic subunit [Selaginella pennata]